MSDTTFDAQLKEIPKVDEDKYKWPTLPDIVQGDLQLDVKKALYQKQLDTYAAMLQAEFEAEIARRVAEIAVNQARKDAQTTASTAQQVAQTASDVERRENEYSNYYAVFQAVQSTYLDIAKTSIANIQARAQFVLTTSGAIVTLYTGLLGLVFTIEKDNNRPLPERGIWAGVFLGLAIVLAAVYFAYITKQPDDDLTNPSAGLRVDAIQRVYKVLEWAKTRALERRYFLQCAVVSLGVGIAFLPAAFIEINDGTVRGLAILGAVAVFGIPGLVKALSSD